MDVPCGGCRASRCNGAGGTARGPKSINDQPPGAKLVGRQESERPTRWTRRHHPQQDANTAVIVATPDIREKLLAADFDPIADTPAQFARYMETKRVKWGKVVRDAGVKPE